MNDEKPAVPEPEESDEQAARRILGAREKETLAVRAADVMALLKRLDKENTLFRLTGRDLCAFVVTLGLRPRDPGESDENLRRRGLSSLAVPLPSWAWAPDAESPWSTPEATGEVKVFLATGSSERGLDDPAGAERCWPDTATLFPGVPFVVDPTMTEEDGVRLVKSTPATTPG